MKKLMIAAAIVCATVAANAAVVNWTSDSVPYAVNAATVVDNGNYTAGTTAMKGGGAWTYIMTFYDSEGELAGKASGDVKLNATSKKFNNLTIDLGDGVLADKDYTYTIVMTGKETSLNARGIDGAYDYTAASMTTTLSGSIHTLAQGNTALKSAIPASWDISGIQAVPEPTSGLLLLLGVAGLALRRRRA